MKTTVNLLDFFTLVVVGGDARFSRESLLGLLQTGTARTVGELAGGFSEKAEVRGAAARLAVAREWAAAIGLPSPAEMVESGSVTTHSMRYVVIGSGPRDADGIVRWRNATVDTKLAPEGVLVWSGVVSGFTLLRGERRSGAKGGDSRALYFKADDAPFPTTTGLYDRDLAAEYGAAPAPSPSTNEALAEFVRSRVAWSGEFPDWHVVPDQVYNAPPTAATAAGLASDRLALFWMQALGALSCETGGVEVVSLRPVLQEVAGIDRAALPMQTLLVQAKAAGQQKIAIDIDGPVFRYLLSHWLELRAGDDQRLVDVLGDENLEDRTINLDLDLVTRIQERSAAKKREK
jgi:hypothetical protein